MTIGGEHLPNRNNSDVVFAHISYSNTPFIIQQLFAVFPNMNELEIRNSNLQEINIMPDDRLEWLTLFGNNIQRIANGTFINQPRLSYIYAVNNSIQHLDVNAFQGLTQLLSLALINNRIEEVAPGTLSPLISARVIDFEGNLLSEVSEEMFAANRNVTTLYLERNRINAVHPNFARNLANLSFIDFSGNVCVDRSFSPGNEEGLISMNNALQTCFNNYHDVTPEVRRVTMEFVGNLTIYDQFGNIIARL